MHLGVAATELTAKKLKEESNINYLNSLTSSVSPLFVRWWWGRGINSHYMPTIEEIEEVFDIESHVCEYHICDGTGYILRQVGSALTITKCECNEY